MLGKKNKEKELEKAKKLIEEEAALDKAKAEQAKPTPTIETGAKVNGNQPSKEELAEIKEAVQYYADNYRGIFNPNESPAQSINPMEAEIACLLFGILQELRKIRGGE